MKLKLLLTIAILQSFFNLNLYAEETLSENINPFGSIEDESVIQENSELEFDKQMEIQPHNDSDQDIRLASFSIKSDYYINNLMRIDYSVMRSISNQNHNRPEHYSHHNRPGFQRQKHQAFLDAVQNNDIFSVRDFLRNGINIDYQSRDGGWSALMIAAYNGHTEIARILIRHGATLNLQHSFGSTALSFAFEKNKYGVAELLLRHGASPYAGGRGRTAVDEAQKQRNPLMMSLLRQYTRPGYIIPR